ncbi:Ferri-bacillibactin esterase BesA [Paracoccus haematequi]|uniref:Ferri-bacillibactin esterase BesA n=1 Tax=Paracoccus haematequi TaxID=2491866 RepID=A0A447IKH4_9RHOB|nr:alpha/beta hydrolase-fold protein [Paracoccus haematequi]VDS07981.1 Ferri-bacillibactin esterase BesA [Paracoccus haematequi]
MIRRHLLVLLAATAATPAKAQPRRHDPPPEIDHPRASHFAFGPEGRQWRIFVGLPDAPPPQQGYSVILSLDGATTFPQFWTHRETRAPGAPVILFGISYEGANRRWVDLTSRAMAPVLPILGYRSAPRDRLTGGREAFLAMIGDELLPELARRYPLDQGDMTLYGHSLGGLFVLHTLFNRPHLFARHVAADPSVWWNAGESQREAAAFAGGVAAAGGRVDPGVQVMIAQAGRARQNHPHDPTSLVRILSGIRGLDVMYRPYPQENHGSLMGPSTADALDLHLLR